MNGLSGLGAELGHGGAGAYALEQRAIATTHLLVSITAVARLGLVGAARDGHARLAYCVGTEHLNVDAQIQRRLTLARWLLLHAQA